MEDPQEDPLAVHCFCVCSRSALLGDLLGVKQIHRTWSSVCPVDLSWDFLVRIHCVSSRSKDSLSIVVFCYMLMCVGCVGLVVSTCQVIGRKDPSENTLTWWGDYLHIAQVEESVCVYFSFVWFVYVPMCSPRPYTIYISYSYDTI